MQTNRRFASQRNFINKSLAAINPNLDYVTFNHIDYLQLSRGKCKDRSFPVMDIEARTEFTYKHKKTGELQNAILHYICTEKQSIRLCIVDLDAVVKVYGKDNPDIELVAATSFLRPLLANRKDQLIRSGEIRDNSKIIKVEYCNFVFPLVTFE